MHITYIFNGEPYAGRTSEFIPRKGDEVRFRGVVYSVLRVVWIEDEGTPRIAIDIELIEKG
jgi:hypothetical protein